MDKRYAEAAKVEAAKKTAEALADIGPRLGALEECHADLHPRLQAIEQMHADVAAKLQEFGAGHAGLDGRLDAIEKHQAEILDVLKRYLPDLVTKAAASAQKPAPAPAAAAAPAQPEKSAAKPAVKS